MIFKVQITALKVNDIQLKFGENSDKEGFFLDGDDLNCNHQEKKMSTAFIGIQDEKVVASICKNSTSQHEHVKYNQQIRKNYTISRLLSIGYEISKPDGNPDGDVYYKKYAKTNFHEAREICENDGTSLPVPRSGWFSVDKHQDHNS